MERIFNFGPNVASFLLMSGSRIWYVLGSYVPPHDVPYFHRIEKALEVALKGMWFILLQDLNIYLREPWYDR